MEYERCNIRLKMRNWELIPCWVHFSVIFQLRTFSRVRVHPSPNSRCSDCSPCLNFFFSKFLVFAEQLFGPFRVGRNEMFGLFGVRSVRSKWTVWCSDCSLEMSCSDEFWQFNPCWEILENSSRNYFEISVWRDVTQISGKLQSFFDISISGNELDRFLGNLFIKILWVTLQSLLCSPFSTAPHKTGWANCPHVNEGYCI